MESILSGLRYFFEHGRSFHFGPPFIFYLYSLFLFEKNTNTQLNHELGNEIFDLLLMQQKS